MLTHIEITHKAGDILEVEITAPIHAWIELINKNELHWKNGVERAVDGHLTAKLLAYVHELAAMVDQQYDNEEAEDLADALDGALSESLGEVWEKV